MRQATSPGGGTRSLRPFYFGIVFFYSAYVLLLQGVRWGLAGAAGSSFLLAATVALPVLPQVLAGLLRLESIGGRRPLHATVLIAAGALGALALVSFAAGGPVLAGLLLAATLVGGWADALAVPQSQASLMQALPTAARVRGSRNFELASRLPSVLAPIAGGALIYALGLPWTLAAAAGLVALGGVFFRGRDTLRKDEAAGRKTLTLGRSIALIRHDRWLLTALLVRGLSNLAWPAYTIALPLLVLHRLHGGAAAYGGLLGLYGVSVMVAAALSGGLRREWLRQVYFLSWVVTGLGFGILAVAPSLPLAGLGAVVAGASSPYVHMALDTHIGTEIPPEDQASLFAFQRLVISAMSIIGSSLVGLALLRATPGEVLFGAGAILAAAGIAGAVSGRLGLRRQLAPPA
jgi:hypothetical protein